MRGRKEGREGRGKHRVGKKEGSDGDSERETGMV